MIIEVFVENWQLDCCGEPIGDGATVTWGINADEPTTSSDDIQRFVEDHHDSVDDSVPHWDVTGRVTEIFAVSNRLVKVPGATFTTNDLSDVAENRVTRAERFHTPPDDFTHMGFRVRLTVDDDTTLPEYVEAPGVAERRQREQVEQESLIAYRNSNVGRRLSALCDNVKSRFSGRIEILRSDRTTGVTIQPLAPGGCAVRWGYFDTGILALVGEGEWALSGSLEGVYELERLVDAAAAGGVRSAPYPADWRRSSANPTLNLHESRSRSRRLRALEPSSAQQSLRGIAEETWTTSRGSPRQEYAR